MKRIMHIAFFIPLLILGSAEDARHSRFNPNLEGPDGPVRSTRRRTFIPTLPPIIESDSDRLSSEEIDTSTDTDTTESPRRIQRARQQEPPRLISALALPPRAIGHPPEAVQAPENGHPRLNGVRAPEDSQSPRHQSGAPQDDEE